MTWMDVDLSGVSVEMELIPEGDYIFELLNGAKYSKFDKDKIEVGAKVAEGELSGRVTYFSYGSPDKIPAMIGALKRLEVAIVRNGFDPIEAEQDKVEYLNYAAGARFRGSIRHREYTNKDGEAQLKAELNVFKVKPILNEEAA